MNKQETYEYAVFSLKSEKELNEKRLAKHGLKVDRVEEMNAYYALVFGFWPTIEMASKFPYTCVLIAKGTNKQYLEYCMDADSDIGAYWCA